MNRRTSNPPRLAVWWLQHACPGRDNDALTGDLIERFREGETRGWFWMQVSIVFAVSVMGEILRHWPYFCYALVGTLMTWFFSDARALRQVPGWLHWNDLAWPWSQVVFELSRPALLALAASSVLAAGLLVERSFGWVSLLRTAAITLALLALGHYSIDLFPWLLRPVPGYSDRKQLVIPVEFVVVLIFSTFLLAAWLGCRSPHRDESRREAANAPLPR